MIGAIKRLVLGVAVNLFVAQGVVYADTPMEQLQETIQQVMSTMNGAGKRNDPELREKLRDALMPAVRLVRNGEADSGQTLERHPGPPA